VRTTITYFALGIATLACGSGGSDPGTASSSSSGSSSGNNNCGGTCESSATITFDEDNSNDRLMGAHFIVCHASRCAEGQLERPDAGSDYRLTLTGGASVYAVVQPGPSVPTPGVLRFTFQFSLQYSGPNAPVDGDVYRFEARVSQLGQTLFERSFTARYQNVTVCGTQCKDFTLKP
jgi:hypothetical protein